jgi:hypothetical protein
MPQARRERERREGGREGGRERGRERGGWGEREGDGEKETDRERGRGRGRGGVDAHARASRLDIKKSQVAPRTIRLPTLCSGEYQPRGVGIGVRKVAV